LQYRFSLGEEQHEGHEGDSQASSGLAAAPSQGCSTVTMRAPAEQALDSTRNMLSAETKIMRKRHGRAI